MKQGVFLRAMASDATEAVIDVCGVIGWEVSYAPMRDMLRSIPDNVKRVIFDIYSPGGDVWEGNGIVQEIGELGKRCETIARVQVAASMATLIAIACQKRSIAANGRFLIHNAWTQTTGDAAAHEKAAQTLKDAEKEAARFYAERTGNKPDEMLALMAEERWMMPEEVKKMGFVQEISDPFKADQYEDVKQEIIAAGKWPKALVELPVESKGEAKDNVSQDASGTGSVAAVEPHPSVEPTNDKIKAAEAIGYARAQAEIEKTRAIEIEGFARKLADRDAVVSAHQSAKDKAEAKILALNADIIKLVETLDESGKLSALAVSNAAKQKESEIAALVKQHDEADNKLRGEILDLTKCLKDANERNAKLLSGGMTFEPAAPASWEEAMQACGNDYVAASKKYPKLREEFNKKNRRK